MSKELTASICRMRTILWSGLFLSLSLAMASGVFAQAVPSETPKPIEASGATPTEVQKPVFQSYKGVEIGSTAENVREKLGKAQIDDKDGFYYEIAKGEIAQIRLDKAGKVRLISVTYSSEGTPPTFDDVFGNAAKTEGGNADGKLYKLVRYPEAGFWVAYSRRAGEKTSVTITIQKIRSSK